MRIAIVGAGFSGIGMAIALRRAGHTDVTVFERSGDIGGTWRDNTYPGAACDVPSYLYSFSFEMKPNWSRKRALQPEILEYMETTSSKYAIDSHYRFNSEVEEAIFDSKTSMWKVSCVKE